MNAQVNWQKIRSEFQRLTDVDQLKSEVQRIGNELRKFDFQTVLSPSAQEKVKTFEKRYAELMRTIHQAQRQMDREFNRILRQIKSHRADVSKVVAEQKDKLETLRKRFATSTASRTARTAGSTTRKRTSKKTTATKSTRKRRK